MRLARVPRNLPTSDRCYAEGELEELMDGLEDLVDEALMAYPEANLDF